MAEEGPGILGGLCGPIVSGGGGTEAHLQDLRVRRRGWCWRKREKERRAAGRGEGPHGRRRGGDDRTGRGKTIIFPLTAFPHFLSAAKPSGPRTVRVVVLGGTVCQGKT